jgi:hypothetical protein
MWRFNATTKFVNPPDPFWQPEFTHDAQVVRVPGADATLNEWEKVAATDGSVIVGDRGINRNLPATLENVTTEPAETTVIGLVGNLQGDRVPATTEQDIELGPGDTRDIELTINISDIELVGFGYLEIAGVRDNPGSAPGIIELTD